MTDCSAGQAALVVWADTAPARWPGPRPDFIPWAPRCPPAAGLYARGQWSIAWRTARRQRRAMLALPRGGRPGDI
eukprot:15433153-Alexandrium_andersonii.AAC.1